MNISMRVYMHACTWKYMHLLKEDEKSKKEKREREKTKWGRQYTYKGPPRVLNLYLCMEVEVDEKLSQRSRRNRETSLWLISYSINKSHHSIIP